LDTPGASTLAELNATFEELQTVLRCCERLVSELAAGDSDPDDVLVEAVWTMALLSYARCFSAGGEGIALTEDDVTATQSHGDVLDWHRVLLRLRDHYADPTANPRERFSVGVAQDPNGAASGVAANTLKGLSKKPALLRSDWGPKLGSGESSEGVRAWRWEP